MSGDPIEDIDAALAEHFGMPEVAALADPRIGQVDRRHVRRGLYRLSHWIGERAPWLGLSLMPASLSVGRSAECTVTPPQTAKLWG
jgi:hypothetical protein